MSRELERNYCGCCGREMADWRGEGWIPRAGDWCGDCRDHVASGPAPSWERTYFAKHKKPCPYQTKGAP